MFVNMAAAAAALVVDDVSGLGESPPKDTASRRRKLSTNIRLNIPVILRRSLRADGSEGVDRGILGHVKRMIKVKLVVKARPLYSQLGGSKDPCLRYARSPKRTNRDLFYTIRD